MNEGMVCNSGTRVRTRHAQDRRCDVALFTVHFHNLSAAAKRLAASQCGKTCLTVSSTSDTDRAKPRLFKYCILPVRQASPHCGVASHLRSESSFSQNEPRIGVFVTSRFQRILGRT